jgi:hypothetical protein
VAPDEAARDDFLCRNDVDTPPERQEEVGRMVREFLESRLPCPSPFEWVDRAGRARRVDSVGPMGSAGPADSPA